MAQRGAGIGGGAREPRLARGKRDGGVVLMRVTQSGALSVCGLDRFPVTLDRDQWLRLLDMAEDIRAFLDENAGCLKP